tara:strand:+ start:3670 stop:3969 length:300 start_codon:yes stop_codon:yes gene_type:complete
MNKVYYPPHAVFYSRIEAFIKAGNRVVIKFNDQNDNRTEKIEMLLELFKSKDSETEFLRLHSGLVIRLDQLVSIDDKIGPKDTCGIDRNHNPCGDASDN